MKLPILPLIGLTKEMNDHIHAYGRACAEAALEAAAMECATRPPDDPIGAWYAAAIRNIEIEEE